MPVQRHVELSTGREVDEFAGLECGASMGGGEHGPAESEPDGNREVGGGGDEVSWWLDHPAGEATRESGLEGVLAVKVQTRGSVKGCGSWPLGEPAGREPRGGVGAEPHLAERGRRATGARSGVARDGRHNSARREQASGVVLVVADELEDNRLSCGDAGKWGQDPGGEGVGVDGDRQSRRSLVVTLRAQLSEGFALEECELLPKSEDGLATLGDTYGLRTNDEDSTDSELERLDALADRTRGHVEGACGRIEGAVLDDDGEGFEELSWNLIINLANGTT